MKHDVAVGVDDRDAELGAGDTMCCSICDIVMPACWAAVRVAGASGCGATPTAPITIAARGRTTAATSNADTTLTRKSYARG